MIILVLAVGTLGAICTWASGGRFRRLGEVEVTWHDATAVILWLMQGVLRNAFAGGLVILWATTLATALALLARRSEPGVKLMIVGIMLNMLVVVANGGMPFDATEAASLGASGAAGDTFHVVAGQSTMVPVLADILPIPRLGLMSLGDLVLLVGLFVMVLSIVLGPAGDDGRLGQNRLMMSTTQCPSTSSLRKD